ncbi:MAG: 5-methyltetrahydropteroyltriglutamate--homocysteine methyltransferase [Planctomycetes bacterium]|nr:5-methyltetrahydropteroyltriglutamate--homocysteine methyltransferase [Planctomycetota bacterium]
MSTLPRYSRIARPIPTEPIGSIPRPLELIEAIKAVDAGAVSLQAIEPLFREAVRDTIREFEASGSPVASDGEQRKHPNFATYAVQDHPNMEPDGFEARLGNPRWRWPRIVKGPFRYSRSADTFLLEARSYAGVPLKQGVAAPTSMSLLYPARPIEGYPREQFLEEVLAEHVREVRACLALGAHTVQIDFAEALLACRLDSSGQLLTRFIQLINLGLNRLLPAEVSRIGVHLCTRGERSCGRDACDDYEAIIPSVLQLRAGRFYFAMAREPDRTEMLGLIRRHIRPDQRVYIGVTDAFDTDVETPEEVRDRILEAAEFIPLTQLGTTDDCGFAPCCGDTRMTREIAFAKVRARVEGTAMASEVLSDSISAHVGGRK